MKKLICVVLAAAVFAAIADEPPPFDLKKKPQTEEEKAAAYDRAEDELGDFLFATVNAARLYGLVVFGEIHTLCSVLGPKTQC